MFCCGVCVLAALVCTVALARSQAPAGLRHRTLLGLFFLIGRVTCYVAQLCEYFGFRNVRLLMMRNNINAVTMKELQTLVQSEDTTLDGVKVRIFRPKALPEENCSGVVYFHGGGWTMGNIDTYDEFTRAVARDTNSVVVSVDYRLAPEHPFPVPFEDCVKATKYFFNNASHYGVDANRVVLMGDSAGGNLATVVSLKLREERFSPAPAAQVLIYPAVQILHLDLPAGRQNGAGPILTRDLLVYFYLSYIMGNSATWRHAQAMTHNAHVDPDLQEQLVTKFINPSRLPDRFLHSYPKPDLSSGDRAVWDDLKAAILDPYCCPLMAEDLSDLPPAYVFTAEHDVLRDEGFLYAARLRDAGVPVQHGHSDIGFHAMMLNVFLRQPEVRKFYDEVIEFTKRHVAQ